MNMNRAQLTEELIKAKNESAEQLTKIDKLTKWKYNSIGTGIIAGALLSMATIAIMSLYDGKVKMQAELASLSIQSDKEIQLLRKDIYDLQSNSSLVYVSKLDLLEDLQKNYPEVSMKVKLQILETVISESEKYNMNPLILYSMIYVESSFRHWLEHDPTTINKNGKQIKIRAVGLTGVVWEWWGEKLIAAGIIETRGDLFDPVANIKAGAFVYNEMYHQEMHKSAKYKDESALLRYFGGDYISYLNKIDAKIATFVRPNLFRKN